MPDQLLEHEQNMSNLIANSVFSQAAFLKPESFEENTFRKCANIAFAELFVSPPEQEQSRKRNHYLGIQNNGIFNINFHIGCLISGCYVNCASDWKSDLMNSWKSKSQLTSKASSSGNRKFI